MQIVLSTTWRNKLSNKFTLQQKLATVGIPVEAICGETVDLGDINLRGTEILDFVKGKNVERYLVIDDMEVLETTIPTENLLRVDGAKGLTAADAEKALVLIEKQFG